MPITERQRSIVLAELEAGQSLVQACQTADLQSRTAWYEEMDRDEELADSYARARERGYKARADALYDVARDESIKPDSRRIIVDTMKWELSKMLPKVYGDRLDLNATVTRTSGDMTTDELLAIAAQAKRPGPDSK